jgi:hypothetical protein
VGTSKINFKSKRGNLKFSKFYRRADKSDIIFVLKLGVKEQNYMLKILDSGNLKAPFIQLFHKKDVFKRLTITSDFPG